MATDCAAPAAAASVQSCCAPPHPWRWQPVAGALLSGGRACGKISAGCPPPAPRGQSEHTASSPSGSCNHTPPFRAQQDLAECLHCWPPNECTCRPSIPMPQPMRLLSASTRGSCSQSCPAGGMLAVCQAVALLSGHKHTGNYKCSQVHLRCGESRCSFSHSSCWRWEYLAVPMP